MFPDFLPIKYMSELSEMERICLRYIFVVNAHRHYGSVQRCINEIQGMHKCRGYLKEIEADIKDGKSYDELMEPFMAGGGFI